MIPNSPAAWDERARTAATSWEAALWSKHSQDVRFHAVRSLLKVRMDDVVLDFGCGTGAFMDFLPDAPMSCAYFGYDWSAEMRARAREEHPGAVIIGELDEDLVFDHVVCIGTFNLRDGWSKEATWDKLEELWAMHTRSSLIVSLYRERGATPASMIGYSPTDVAGFAERLGASSFVLRADHLPNDLILGAYRVADRHGSPAELPAGDVGHLEDPRE